MLTTITAIIGVLFGLSSLVISLLNYRRDRPKLIISLRWDAITVRDREGREATYGQIHLTNAGRRPIYIQAAGIEYDPPGASWYRRTERQGKVKGRKLAEGDPPVSLVVEAGPGFEMLKDHGHHWREFRAFAEDSNGKRYFSPKTEERPSWGVGDGRVPNNLIDAGRIIECNLEQHQLESYLIKGDWVLIPSAEVDEMKKAAHKLGIEFPNSEGEEGTRLVTFIGRTGRPSGFPP